MSGPLVFLDTETTGLELADDIWEFAAIRREPDGTEEITHLFLRHDVEKCKRLPESFRLDHEKRFPASHTSGWHPDAIQQDRATDIIAELFADRPHVVGAVPNFDTERLALLLIQFGYKPGWHYHLIDVENLAVGYLMGRRIYPENAHSWSPPWESDELSRAVGVEPPSDEERHTALGDARWAMRLYDAIMGGDMP